MTDRTTSDLAALLTPPPSTGVQFSQGRILTWDNETLHNTVEWRGITLTDIPIVEGINALVLRPGDIVGMLGWAPGNAKGVGSWWILGKLSNPGEFVADLNITAKIFRLNTREGYPLAFFGDEADGDPLWILYYGGADGQSAFRILDGNDIYVHYRDGSTALRISGDVGSQIIQTFDQAGNEMFSTNGTTNGVGMADPWIPYNMFPTTSAEQLGTTYLPATTNATFTAIWRGFNPVYHPVIAYGVNVTATGSPEWRIRVNYGIGDFTGASGTGTQGGTFPMPNFGAGFNPGTQVEFQLEARNTGGGTTHIGLDRLYGRQS